MKNLLFCAFFCAAGLSFALDFPKEFFELENAVYSQEFSQSQIENFYNEAAAKSESFSESQKFAYLSLCQELLGRSKIFFGDKEAARKIFDEGVSLAEKSLKIEKSAEASEALVKNISQNMRTRSAAYMVKNGMGLRGKIEEILKIEPNSLWGKYLAVSQDVYAPKAFANAKRGKTEAKSLLVNETKMSAALRFNSWTALAKAQVLLKEFDDAEISIKTAEKIFPKNEEIANLRKELRR